MKSLNKILSVFLFLFCATIVTAQDDFDVKLSETEINNTLDAIIAARGFNFGDYTGQFGLSYWIANIDAAHVDILPNNQIKLIVDDLYFLTDINLVLVSFTTTEHLSGTFNGEIIMQGDETNGYNLILHLNSVDINSWGDLGAAIGNLADLFLNGTILNWMPDVNLSLTDLTPNLVTETFNFGDPPLSSDNENIYLNFNVKGDRFVTITNELEIPGSIPVKDKGSIYHLENGTYAPYNAGFEFVWAKNSVHTVKSEENGIDYEGDNNHYKFNVWTDNQPNIVRQITADKDYRFTAKLNNSYNVNFGMTYEGISGGFGNINISGNDYTFPKNEYIFAAPLGEQVTVNQTINNNGKEYNFLGWSDGNANLVRTISPTSALNLTAKYKGIQLSNNASAYSNNNQRKTAAIQGGEYITVYESMGKIWIEKLKLDGTWELMGNSDLAANIYECKNPSIAVDGNNLFIVFQENISNTRFNVRLMAFDVAGNSAVTLDNELVRWLNEDVSYDNVNPVIAITENFPDIKNILVAWKEKSSFAYPAGLYLSNFTFNDQPNQLAAINYWENIQGTDINSYNPSLSTLKNQSGNLIYHLTWQQNISSSSQVIKYTTITDNNGTLSIGTIETPSSGSGYTKNYNPTITVMDNNVVRVGWVGYRLNSGISKTNNSEKIIGTPEYRAVMRERTTSGWSGTFYKLSSSVKTININRSDDNNSIYAWVSSNGSSNQYMLNKDTEILGVISNPGDYLQLSGGSTTTEMKAIKFETGTTPYAFSKSDITLAAPKTSGNQYSAGREGIISKDGAEFYFVIGDVTLDGNNVAFTPITNEIDSSNYFSYLESEKMSVNDNSSLTYSVLYGFVDSLRVAELLTENNEINFSVELVDANTEELLGVYDNVTYNRTSLYQYDNIAYSLNMNGIGNREVKLRLRIEENIGGKYTLADITAEEELLPKTSVKELSYQGELAVREYALEQNYPNPFNPSTTIKYQLPKNGNVKLVIYDMLGREVKTLVNGFKQKGRYEVQFDASGLSSGVYIYRIEVNEFSASRKMMLIK